MVAYLFDLNISVLLNTGPVEVLITSLTAQDAQTGEHGGPVDETFFLHFY